MFKPVGSLLRNSRVSNKSSDAIIAMRVRQVAGDLIKKEMSIYETSNIKVTTFRSGILTISALPIVAGELHMRSGGLIRDINRALGGGFVRAFKFRS